MNNILYSLFYSSINYFEKGFYKYYLNLENLIVLLFYYFIDNKK